MSASKYESYPQGYPRYTALLSTHSPYMICRRFDVLRARLLLLKQDRLTILEQELETLDREEKRPLLLGKMRIFDADDRRSQLLEEIDRSLLDYDNFIGRTCSASSLPAAKRRDLISLQNWVINTGSIAREESAYLYHSEDLVSLGRSKDDALDNLETVAEKALVLLWQHFQKLRLHDKLLDPNVFIYSGHLIRRSAIASLLLLITIILMVPVIICNVVTSGSVRIVVVVISTICYLVLVLFLTKARSTELIIAAATYATLLTVFISGSGAGE